MKSMKANLRLAQAKTLNRKWFIQFFVEDPYICSRNRPKFLSIFSSPYPFNILSDISVNAQRYSSVRFIK